MKNSDQINKETDLVLLVRSASPEEKLFFKRSVKKLSARTIPKHIHLFDLIDKHSIVKDEEQKKLLKIKSGPQFSAIKKYLFRELLEKLAEFMLEKELTLIQDFALLKIRILILRKIYDSAAKMINEEKQRAVELQLYEKHLRLLEVEYEFFRFSSGKGLIETLNQQTSKINEAIAISTQFDSLNCIFRRMINLRNHTNTRAMEEEIAEVKVELKSLETIAAKRKENPLTNILFHTAMAMGSYLIQDRNVCSRHCQVLMDLIVKHATLTNTYPKLFREAAYILFYHDFLWSNTTAITNKLEQLENVFGLNKHLNDKKTWQVIKLHTELKIHHKNADYEELKIMLKEKGSQLVNYSLETIPNNEAMSIITSIAISYFVLNEFNSADELLYKLKDMNRKIQRSDVFYFTLIFHLLIIFEKKDWYRLYNTVEAAYQQLYKMKKLRPFEKELMLFFKKLPQLYTDRKLYERTTREFISSLEEYKQDPIRNMYFRYFNYHGWLQSKVENIPYTEYVKRNLSK